jgi:large subunit ribosomal protein L20
MIRITRGNIRIKKRKKFFKFCKGYKQLKNSIFIMEQRTQSLFYSYIGRKLKKRNFNKLWIILINNLLRLYHLNYSIFIQFLKKNHVYINKQLLLTIIYNNIILIQHLVKSYF